MWYLSDFECFFVRGRVGMGESVRGRVNLIPSLAYIKRFLSLSNKVLSFWNKFHNNALSEDPWGQPRDILDHSLLLVPSFTRLYLSFRNDRIRSSDWLANTYALSFLMTKLWHRVKSLAQVYIDRMVANSFLSIACFHSSVRHLVLLL